MPMEKSIFNNKSITDFLKETYGYKASFIEHIDEGTANIYKIICCDSKEIILKEFPTEFPEKRICLENKILNHLNNSLCTKGLVFPEYLYNLNGSYISCYKNHYIILQDYIDGEKIKPFQGNDMQTNESAIVYANIIESLKSMKITFPLYQQGMIVKDVIKNSIDNHKRLLEVIKENKVKDEICEKIIILQKLFEYDFNVMNDFTFANCHGDYNISQLLFNKSGRLFAVVDFLSAKKMPVVIELVRSFFYMNNHNSYNHIDIKRLCDYILHFEENTNLKLSTIDIKYMLVPYLIRLATSTFGYVNEPSIFVELAHKLFLQCKMIFGNLSEYSEEINEILL